MSGVNKYDLIILGAGFAGLSLADAALVHGKKCLVLEKNYAGSGASGSPGILANPASGRRARMSWMAEECFTHLLPFIRRIESFSGLILSDRSGTIRPALTKKIAKDFKKSPQKYSWPDGWLHWIEPDQVTENYPFLGEQFGLLRVEQSLSVRGDLFCSTAADYLQRKGIEFGSATVNYMEQTETGWKLTFDGTVSITPHLVDCTGWSQLQSPYWSYIPFHAVKGQAATFRFPFVLPFKESISSLGYMATLPGLEKELTVGSTYEHHFENLEPDTDGLNYLKQKLENTLPGYSNQFSSVRQWASCRVSLPDKMPVIGRHGELEGLYIIGGLGSKGFLLSRYLGELLIAHIFNHKPLDPSISTDRFSLTS